MTRAAAFARVGRGLLANEKTMRARIHDKETLHPTPAKALFIAEKGCSAPGKTAIPTECL